MITSMEKKPKNNYQKLIDVIKKGGIGVLPTDTLYGLVGSAFSAEAVEKIYKIRERNTGKPFIILIGSISDLKKFGIKIDKKSELIIKKIWPGKVSIIFPVKNKKFQYLHRGTKSIAFRLPKKESLIHLLKKTGPLVAPSANREGDKPATTILKAKQYFGEKINFYADGGTLRAKPSTLIAIDSGKVIIKRQGAVRIKKNLWQN
jgi:L-threonylcarbamoyladenylate synthase